MRKRSAFLVVSFLLVGGLAHARPESSSHHNEQESDAVAPPSDEATPDPSGEEQGERRAEADSQGNPSEEPTAAEPLGPALPEGMTLGETLDRAAQSPPRNFPSAIHDDKILTFFQGDQAEYRLDPRTGDTLGWEATMWVGGDFNRIVLKPEGEVSPTGLDQGESETDIVYSRLVLPFWSIQAGGQYANEWGSEGGYSDRVSATASIQGLAPGKFEVDASVYLSQGLHVTSTVEVEYDWRLTQRLALQPRTEVSVAAQNIEARNLGAGITNVVAGLRLRYELKREFAPYMGVRYQRRLFRTADLARDAGNDVGTLIVVGGIRFALL